MSTCQYRCPTGINTFVILELPIPSNNRGLLDFSSESCPNAFPPIPENPYQNPDVFMSTRSENDHVLLDYFPLLQVITGLVTVDFANTSEEPAITYNVYNYYYPVFSTEKLAEKTWDIAMSWRVSPSPQAFTATYHFINTFNSDDTQVECKSYICSNYNSNFTAGLYTTPEQSTTFVNKWISEPGIPDSQRNYAFSFGLLPPFLDNGIVSVRGSQISFSQSGVYAIQLNATIVYIRQDPQPDDTQMALNMCAYNTSSVYTDTSGRPVQFAARVTTNPPNTLNYILYDFNKYEVSLNAGETVWFCIMQSDSANLPQFNITEIEASVFITKI